MANKSSLAHSDPGQSKGSDDDVRELIAAAALQCFARNGFAGTSIADIETEAGFSVGSGSTYRYFKTKRALLEAAVAEALERADALSVASARSLEEAAQAALASMDEIGDLVRIALRDLDRFPELFMPVIDRLIDGPVRAVADQMADAAPDLDSEAVATLLVGALVNVKVLEALGGSRPGTVDEQRLVTAWAQLYRLALEYPE